VLWLLAGCPDIATCGKCTAITTPEPTTSFPTTSPTGLTGETAQDTGWTTTGTLLTTTVGPWQPCPSGTEVAPRLEVTEVTADHVTIARSGPIVGCTYPTELRAALNGSAVNLHWVGGACQTVLCGIGSATIAGLPAGTYTLSDPAPGADLSADLTVP
jgi:hypothetical protein